MRNLDPGVQLAATVFMVLAIGAVLGLVSRTLLQGRSSLSAPAAIVAGILGAGLGGIAAYLITGRPSDLPFVAIALAGLVGTVAVLLVGERFARTPEPTVLELLNAGESATVEFKSTARHNMRTELRDERIEAVIPRTVAGFLNSQGGTLLIGVDDNGVVLGLGLDLQHMKQPDLDRYELWINDYVSRNLGASCLANVAVSFPSIGGTTVCMVRVRPSNRPVYMRAPRTQQVQFFTRMGNSTRDLPVDEAIAYAMDRFPRRRLRED